MLTNGGEARVLGENSPLALALPKALGRAIVSESETRSDCIKSSLVVIISVTCSIAKLDQIVLMNEWVSLIAKQITKLVL